MAEEKPSRPYVVDGADGQSTSDWQWISVFLGWGLLQSGKTVTWMVFLRGIRCGTVSDFAAKAPLAPHPVMASADEKV
ncbi:hypothetical protein BN1708_010760 [Verticillium longisporum]|uniref:Uncharacterized protein n=1 Tax=Verticillium longisporum TaxID=100787 RepID=A0A0G4KU97_VERLO|nr:hypothetical protein BN1708_010760 [Verticillium longisporum]